MKNLIPFMALLVLGGSFTVGSPVEAKGKKCEKKCEKASGGDECCKDGGDKSKCEKTDKVEKADKSSEKKEEAKPAAK